MIQSKPPYLGTLGKRAVLGSQLFLDDQCKALRNFPNRFTGTHRPVWADVPANQPCVIQFKDDADWLENTYFKVDKAGKLILGWGKCESHPTWPLGRPDRLPDPPRVAGPKTIGELNAAEDAVITGLCN